MIRRLVVAFAAIGLLLTGGCGSLTGSAPASSAQITVPALPAHVSVAVIDAESSLIPLGLKADNTLDVPPVTEPLQASWYENSPVPGMPGPAVILGHINGRVNGVSTPGVFSRLAAMQIGDSAVVTDKDNKPHTFTVYKVETVPKNNFPADRVFGDTDGPELRLITCGGRYIGGDLGYADNSIVYLRLS